MPIGGSAVSWDEATPAGSESIGLGDDRIRSLKTAIREGLSNEHVWPSDGSTLNRVGAHRYGSARAHWGLQSHVSTSGDSFSAGRMMITSDTSRLFSVASTVEDNSSKASAFMLGAGPLAPSFHSFLGVFTPNADQLAHIVVQVGHSSASSAHAITFPKSYNGIPFVFVSADSEALSGNKPGKFARIIGVSQSQLSVQMISSENGDALDSGVYWLSIGSCQLAP